MELNTSFYMAQLFMLLVMFIVDILVFFSVDNKNIRFWVATFSWVLVGIAMTLFFDSLLGFFPA